MPQESLELFVKQQFLQPGATQDQLKATKSFDEFVTLMVSLGSEQGYQFTAEEVKTLVQHEIDTMKQQIQEGAEKDMAEMKTELPDIDPEQLQSIQEEADKLKADIDRAVLDSWQKNRVVEMSIANFKKDHVLPLY